MRKALKNTEKIFSRHFHTFSILQIFFIKKYFVIPETVIPCKIHSPSEQEIFSGVLLLSSFI